MLPISLDGQVALVTGVTSGIGAGIATALATAGCDVVGCATSSEQDAGAQRFLRAVEDAGREARYVVADVTRPGDLARLTAAAGGLRGRIDVLVSNAGRNVFEGAAECTDDEWDACMELDLAAHWKLARHARPWMDRADHPVVLVVSSNHAFRTIPGCFPYNVAKAGLTALIQSLAIEWGPKYRAVGIAPGFIDTPINTAWFAKFPDPALERRRTEARHPVGRLGTVEEIGALCAFLASAHAGFITGTTFIVDGGRSALMQDGAEYVAEPPSITPPTPEHG